LVLRDAIGINFNVPSKLAVPTARLLGDSGFTRARVEVGWGSLEYEDPSRIGEPDRRAMETELLALRENGIRPLIVLNANHARPCPVKRSTVELTEPGAIGATVIRVDPADLGKIAAGRTGVTSEGVAARTLFTSTTPEGRVTLSRPLTEALPAGPLEVETLRYEPFRPAKLADGMPNPAFEPTLEGWLDYVGVVTREAKSILGSEEFDVEIWNELSFGSRFLNINSYYEPDLEWTANGNSGAILTRTVEYLRDPAHGAPNVGIGNGFANQSPWASGTTSPPGLTAIDKHPYSGWLSFPREAQVDGTRPLNGLGEPSGWRDALGIHEAFTPTYDAFFPEYFLSGIQTETLIHDLAPAPSTIEGVAHGRYTHPPGSSPPAMWITEVNLSPTSGPTPRQEMSSADVSHTMAKDTLRYLVAYVNKGVRAIDLFAADAGTLSLVSPAFFAAAEADGASYPGDALGGQTTDAVRRLAASMQGAEPISAPRSLSLRSLTDYEGHTQFAGDGTAQFPPLYNRDVFAFFPFQVDAHRFVIPVYVMTRNVVAIQNPGKGPTDPARLDLPAEPYLLKIGGVDGRRANVSASDPLSGRSVPVTVVSRGADEIGVRVSVTDSPRLLAIEEQAEAPAAAPPPTEEPVTGAAAGPASSRSTLRLVAMGALLRRRRMTAMIGCRADCLFGLRARLVIGGRSFEMRATPSGPTAAEAGPAIVRLSIGPDAASRARAALRRGKSISVHALARIRVDGSGQVATATRVMKGRGASTR
jgi:hypothetical protein